MFASLQHLERSPRVEHSRDCSTLAVAFASTLVVPTPSTIVEVVPSKIVVGSRRDASTIASTNVSPERYPYNPGQICIIYIGSQIVLYPQHMGSVSNSTKRAVQPHRIPSPAQSTTASSHTRMDAEALV